MWWKRSKGGRTAKIPDRRRFRPAVEVLEGRLLLATFVWVGNNMGETQWWSNKDDWQVGGVKATSPPGTADDVVLDNRSNANGDSTVDTAFTGQVNSITMANG